jgi:hypothetical protein
MNEAERNDLLKKDQCILCFPRLRQSSEQIVWKVRSCVQSVPPTDRRMCS